MEAEAHSAGAFEEEEAVVLTRGCQSVTQVAAVCNSTVASPGE